MPIDAKKKNFTQKRPSETEGERIAFIKVECYMTHTGFVCRNEAYLKYNLFFVEFLLSSSVYS